MDIPSNSHVNSSGESSEFDITIDGLNDNKLEKALKKAIEEKNNALAEVEDLKTRINSAENNCQLLEEEKAKFRNQIRMEREEMENSATRYKAQLDELQKKIENLTREKAEYEFCTECKLANANKKVIVQKAANKEKIEMADDVLMKWLEWIPLRNLPNVILLSRRLWLLADANLEARKYLIHQMRINADPDRLEVMRIVDGVIGAFEAVPFAQVEPPRNFQLKPSKDWSRVSIQLARNIGEEAMEFLRVSKRLFVGARLALCSMINVHRFLEVFDKCREILIIRDPDQTLTEQFFAQASVVNCKSIVLYPSTSNDTSVFDWLHTPLMTSYSNATRQLFIPYDFRTDGFPNTLIELIKKKFVEDEDSHKFVFLFSRCPEPQNQLRLENRRTGEVLFIKRTHRLYKLIRCSKGEENTVAVAYEYIDKEEHKLIKIQ